MLLPTSHSKFFAVSALFVVSSYNDSRLVHMHEKSPNDRMMLQAHEYINEQLKFTLV